MLSFLNMECPACEAEYTLSIEELNVMVLFKCFDCGQANMYVAGNIIGLDSEIMESGTEADKKRHIVETAQTFVCEFAGNVLQNVDRVIDVNMETAMETELSPVARRRKEKHEKKAALKDEMDENRVEPSIVAADALPITRKEMDDFRRIDLHLIDKEDFFNRHFGSQN